MGPQWTAAAKEEYERFSADVEGGGHSYFVTTISYDFQHCSMPGNEASAARDRVYSTLLKHCTDEQKFTIVGRL